MKKIILFFVGMAFYIPTFGQDATVIQPSVMVIPDKDWCIKNGFKKELDDQGTVKSVVNYELALQNNEVRQAISKINELMAKRGFRAENLSTAMAAIDREQARQNTRTKNGSSIVESPYDMLLKTVKTDIILSLEFNITTTGPKKTLYYRLEAIDPYTEQSFGGSSNTGAPSYSADVPTLLQEAVVANFDNFINALQMYFDDVRENGREITVIVQVFENDANINLETEYGDKELNEIIKRWMYENTVKHSFKLSRSSENFLEYKPVRIPLFDADGMAMDSENFVKSLQKFLKKSPYNITASVDMYSLGLCYLNIGK